MKGQPNNAQASGSGAQPAWMGMASHYVPQSPVFATGNPAVAGGGAPGVPPPIASGLYGGAGGNVTGGFGGGTVNAPMGAPNAAGGAFSTPGVMQNNTAVAAPMTGGAMPPTGAMPAQNGVAGNPALHSILSQLPPGLLGALGGGGGGGGMPPWLMGLLGGGAGGGMAGMTGGGMAGGNMAPPSGTSAPMMMSNFARPY
jgi:hypothetical protein